MLRHNNQHPTFALLYATLFAIIVAACASTATQRPKTFEERANELLLVADNVVTATRTLLAAKKISPDNAESIAHTARSVREGVKVATEMAAKECPTAEAICTPKDANTRLRLAADLLDSMKDYVGEK